MMMMSHYGMDVEGDDKKATEADLDLDWMAR